MSTSIPISGLNRISVITGSDYIPLVQSSSITTFRTHLSSVLDLVAASGSASSSLSSISASYAKSSSYSVTSSYSVNSFSSSNSISASYAQNASTASFSFNSISSSYTLLASTSSFGISGVTSSFAFNAKTASYLLYSGGNNGTASYAINANNSATSSYNISSSFSNTSNTSFNSTSSSFATTASYAIHAGTADTVVGGSGFNLTNISPVLFSGRTDSTWQTIDASSYIPVGAKFAYVLLVVSSKDTGPGTSYYSKNHSTSFITPWAYWSNVGDNVAVQFNSTVFIPLTTSRTFDLFFGNPSHGAFGYVVGYTT